MRQQLGVGVAGQRVEKPNGQQEYAELQQAAETNFFRDFFDGAALNAADYQPC